eukprot:SAG31_NODE_45163_length_260_cov_0.621118_1_plen_21_part_01
MQLSSDGTKFKLNYQYSSGRI